MEGRGEGGIDERAGVAKVVKGVAILFARRRRSGVVVEREEAANAEEVKEKERRRERGERRDVQSTPAKIRGQSTRQEKWEERERGQSDIKREGPRKGWAGPRRLR